MKEMMSGNINRRLAILFLLLILVTPPAARAQQAQAVSADQQEASCAEAMRLLAEHDAKVGRELRRIQRDLAAMKQTMAEPGPREAVAGIGYIVGLLGLAAFVAARRKSGTEKKGT